jgi:hypothetical protein
MCESCMRCLSTSLVFSMIFEARRRRSPRTNGLLEAAQPSPSRNKRRKRQHHLCSQGACLLGLPLAEWQSHYIADALIRCYTYCTAAATSWCHLKGFTSVSSSPRQIQRKKRAPLLKCLFRSHRMRGGYSPIRPTPSCRVSSSSPLWSECVQSPPSVALGGQPPCESR